MVPIFSFVMVMSSYLKCTVGAFAVARPADFIGVAIVCFPPRPLVRVPFRVRRTVHVRSGNLSNVRSLDQLDVGTWYLPK